MKWKAGELPQQSQMELYANGNICFFDCSGPKMCVNLKMVFIVLFYTEDKDLFYHYLSAIPINIMEQLHLNEQIW